MKFIVFCFEFFKNYPYILKRNVKMKVATTEIRLLVVNQKYMQKLNFFCRNFNFLCRRR